MKVRWGARPELLGAAHKFNGGSKSAEVAVGVDGDQPGREELVAQRVVFRLVQGFKRGAQGASLPGGDARADGDHMGRDRTLRGDHAEPAALLETEVLVLVEHVVADGRGLDLAAVAAACGFAETGIVTDMAGVAGLCAVLHRLAAGPRLFVLRVEARNLPRSLPARDAVYLKTRFRAHLGLGVS